MDPARTKEFGTFPSIYNTRSIDRQVTIYDSTLRDGEQMPGVSFTHRQKLDIATALDEIHVPQIEAGLPPNLGHGRKIAKEIASVWLEAEIQALSRLYREDIAAVMDWHVFMIRVFVATS